MGYIVRMPQIGMSMDEGTVVEWTVDKGAEVDEGKVIAIVESEKASADVESREDGVLRMILAEEGQVVEPGDPIGIVAGRDESVETHLDEIDVGSLDKAASERTVETEGNTEKERGSFSAPEEDVEAALQDIEANGDREEDGEGESSARTTGWTR